jgi:hypothetical protein
MGAGDYLAHSFIQEPFDLHEGQKTLSVMILEHLIEQGLATKAKQALADSEWTDHEMAYLISLFQGNVTSLGTWGEGAISKSAISWVGTFGKPLPVEI